ncbi:MAG: hypothetical protein LQ346_000614 [Caloplaca aetnensis]|nr:MAG: hypothetical protein LQ346_000614 [Caloplaca aetnensis]
MSKVSNKDSAVSNNSAQSSPRPTLTDRIRNLAFPRNNSGSPGKSEAHSHVWRDQNPALEIETPVDLGQSQSVKQEALTQAELSLELQLNPGSIYMGDAFLDCLQCQPYRPFEAQRIYDTMIATAASPDVYLENRLSSIKLLARLRCDCSGNLQFSGMPDTQGLAALLLRTGVSNKPPHLSNRVSMTEEAPPSRSGRSGVKQTAARSQSNSRTPSVVGERSNDQLPSLWMYPEHHGSSLDIEPLETFPVKTYATEPGVAINPVVDLSLWLDIMIDVLEKGSDWEIYSYVLVHLPSQLTNVSLCLPHLAQLERLHDVVVFQLQKGKFFEPPGSTGLKKGDVALCLYHTLTILIAYSEWLPTHKVTDTVSTFLIGMSMWDRTGKCCIHAITLCCHELPKVVDRCLPQILSKMSQIISQSHLAIDALELLNHLARLPAAYQQSIGEELQRTIFGICIGYLRHVRDARDRVGDAANPRSANRLSRVSGDSALQSPPSQSAEVDKDLNEYTYMLAYQIITHWFLAISIEDRAKHVSWILKNLAWKDKSGKIILEEQSQVTLDMMYRTAYLDLGETVRPSIDEKRTIKKTYLRGWSIVTIETIHDSGLSYITTRQASGTTFGIFQQNYQPLPVHHMRYEAPPKMEYRDPKPKIYPSHVLLNLAVTPAPIPIPEQPIILPDNELVQRAISTFDRTDTVDGHKAGVIYIPSGRKDEQEILAARATSQIFETFLAGLGTKVKLQGATFNTQGLDRTSNMDGTHTYAWRDRVTEIVYHVPSMMPTNEETDPQCTNKKRHIGNDFVNIIFNESGLPFRFGTFASAFNFVNIVITPEQVHLPLSSRPSPDQAESEYSSYREFFKVQVMWDPSFPETSPAAIPKIVAASTLPGYVRQITLNASVFCFVWSNRGEGEYISSWRSRLREINRLRKRYENTATSASEGYPGMGNAKDRGGAKSYVEGDEWKGIHLANGLAEQDNILFNLDFTRFA